MSDEYISREAAIRAFGSGDPIEYQSEIESKMLSQYVRAAKAMLKAIPAADVVERPHWISMTERLPEKRKWVLCRCEANIIEVLRWENDEWYHYPMHVYYPSFVTHWMPLPEPPKEET